MQELSGIPLKEIAQATSKATAVAFSLGKLPTLLITQYNTNLPTPKWSEFSDALSVGKTFGYSTQKNFADNYFGFVSKMAQMPEVLTIYTWSKTATPATLKGGRCPDLEVLKSLNGKFKLSIGGKSADLSVNLTGQVSYSDCATQIENAIKGNTGGGAEFTNAKCIYSEVTGGFIIKGGVSGATSSIGFVEAPSGGTDIHTELGLTENQGASIIDGVEAEGSINDALNSINAQNGNYFVITTDFKFADEANDIKEFGDFIKTSAGRYLGLYLWNNPRLLTNNEQTLNLMDCEGLMLEYAPNYDQNGFSAGIISSLNFNQTMGNVGVAFNPAKAFAKDAITDLDQYHNLLENKVNCIARFGSLGQFQTWYVMGDIMGDIGSVNGYVANCFLIFDLQFATARMFDEQPFVGVRGEQNMGIMRSYYDPVFTKAQLSGIIVKQYTLEAGERTKILSTFGEEGELAVEQLEREGFFYKINGYDQKNKKSNITMAYVKNDQSRGVVITNIII